MSQYVLRRLLIAVPSLLGISLVLFVVLALAPGDPFSELATNPNVPPEVALALRAKFGLDDPIYLRYLHWLAAVAQGEWGFFLSQPDQRRHADPATSAGDALRDRFIAGVGASDRDPGRRLRRHPAVFDLRPD